MTTYRVKWEIDIEADSPEAAAVEAREIQLDFESIATYFEVFELDDIGRTTQVVRVDVGADFYE